MGGNAVVKITLIYFAAALPILAVAYFYWPDPSIPEFLSVLLLIPIYVWHREYHAKGELSKEINGRDKSTVLFLIFMLFLLAMYIRLPSALLFGNPYEKTPLIYLTVLTIVIVERTSVSVFGFKTRRIGRALLYGLGLYLLLDGLAYAVRSFLIYGFTSQLPIFSFDVASFLFAMPFMALCVGISEEGLFRGYMQTHFEKFYTPRKAILFQATFFGAWHFVWNLVPFDPVGMAFYIAATFSFGLMFGYFYSKARNLAPLILAHGLWNSVRIGSIAVEAASNTIPESAQILFWALPYAVSATVTLLFIKYLLKEI